MKFLNAAVLLVTLFCAQAPLVAQASRESENAACMAALDGRITPGLAEVLQGDGRRNATVYVLLDVSAAQDKEAVAARIIGGAKKVADNRGLRASSPPTLWHLDRGVAFIEVTGTIAKLRKLLARAFYFHSALWVGLTHSRVIAVHHRLDMHVQPTVPATAEQVTSVSADLSAWLNSGNSSNAGEIRSIRATVKRGLSEGARENLITDLNSIFGEGKYRITLGGLFLTLLLVDGTRVQIEEVTGMSQMGHVEFTETAASTTAEATRISPELQAWLDAGNDSNASEIGNFQAALQSPSTDADRVALNQSLDGIFGQGHYRMIQVGHARRTLLASGTRAQARTLIALTGVANVDFARPSTAALPSLEELEVEFAAGAAIAPTDDALIEPIPGAAMSWGGVVPDTAKFDAELSIAMSRHAGETAADIERRAQEELHIVFTAKGMTIVPIVVEGMTVTRRNSFRTSAMATRVAIARLSQLPSVASIMLNTQSTPAARPSTAALPSLEELEAEFAITAAFRAAIAPPVAQVDPVLLSQIAAGGTVAALFTLRDDLSGLSGESFARAPAESPSNRAERLEYFRNLAREGYAPLLTLVDAARAAGATVETNLLEGIGVLVVVGPADLIRQLISHPNVGTAAANGEVFADDSAATATVSSAVSAATPPTAPVVVPGVPTASTDLLFTEPNFSSFDANMRTAWNDLDYYRRFLPATLTLDNVTSPDATRDRLAEFGFDVGAITTVGNGLSVFVRGSRPAFIRASRHLQVALIAAERHFPIETMMWGGEAPVARKLDLRLQEAISHSPGVYPYPQASVMTRIVVEVPAAEFNEVDPEAILAGRAVLKSRNGNRFIVMAFPEDIVRMSQLSLVGSMSFDRP